MSDYDSVAVLLLFVLFHVFGGFVLVSESEEDGGCCSAFIVTLIKINSTSHDKLTRNMTNQDNWDTTFYFKINSA